MYNVHIVVNVQLKNSEKDVQFVQNWTVINAVGGGGRTRDIIQVRFNSPKYFCIRFQDFKKLITFFSHYLVSTALHA